MVGVASRGYQQPPEYLHARQLSSLGWRLQSLRALHASKNMIRSWVEQLKRWVRRQLSAAIQKSRTSFRDTRLVSRPSASN